MGRLSQPGQVKITIILYLDYGKPITNLLYPDYGSSNGIQLFFKTRKFLLGLATGKKKKKKKKRKV